MPLYEYKCLDCNSKFEVLIKDLSEEIACENCGSKNIKRLISAFSFATTGDSGVRITSGSSCSTCSSKSCSACKTS
ncbi:MAG: zinc ribbon domain-containing protein [bacterium]|nr:zinc ribbon domain-containing protein [bacterium]